MDKIPKIFPRNGGSGWGFLSPEIETRLLVIAWVASERLGGKNGFRLYIEDLTNHITSLKHVRGGSFGGLSEEREVCYFE